MRTSYVHGPFPYFSSLNAYCDNLTLILSKSYPSFTLLFAHLQLYFVTILSQSYLSLTFLFSHPQMRIVTILP